MIPAILDRQASECPALNQFLDNFERNPRELSHQFLKWPIDRNFKRLVAIMEVPFQLSQPWAGPAKCDLQNENAIVVQ
jgi:hypothetical protein